MERIKCIFPIHTIECAIAKEASEKKREENNKTKQNKNTQELSLLFSFHSMLTSKSIDNLNHRAKPFLHSVVTESK